MAEERKRLSISLTEDMANNVKTLAKEYGLTQSGLIAVLVRNELKKLEKEKEK